MKKLGLRQKINFVLLAMISLSICCIIFFAYNKAKAELVKAVDIANIRLANTVAAQIQTINEREFKMIESLANLSIIRDRDVDMHDKWELINTAPGSDKYYIGLGIFDKDGIGWTTTNKWQDLHERYYVEKSMKGQRVIQDPEWSKVNGHLASFYAVPVKDKLGAQIAEISVSVDASNLCSIVSKLTFGKNSNPFVVSRYSKKYVAHKDIDIVSKGTLATDNLSAGLQPIMTNILAGQSGTAVYYDEQEKQKFSIAYTPIAGSDWTSVCIAPFNDFYGGIAILLHALIVMAVVSIVATFFIGGVVIGHCIKPVAVVANEIKVVASGDADLSKRLAVKTEDEVGLLSESFNDFMAKLQSIIRELMDTKSNLKLYGEHLSNMVQNNSDFVANMIGGIQNVNTEIQNQNVRVDEAVQASDGISDASSSLDSILKNQDETIKAASSSVTAVINTINEMGHSIEGMVSEFIELEESLKQGINSQHDVSRQIAEIENQSKMLTEANDVISDIADQTNLLAMNAAIEAAHAGESGKGFAVVADEIRKLSVNSAEQSDSIGKQLNAILQSITRVVESAALSDKEFVAVQGKIGDTATLIRGIRQSVESQVDESKKVASELDAMQNSTMQVIDAANDVNDAREKITSNIASLKTSSDTIKEIAETMDKQIRNSQADDDSLMQIASNVNSAIYSIGSQIDQFRV